MSGRNVLSNDVEIKGSIKFGSELMFDAKIEGEVISEGNLTVGENAEITGEVRTRTVVIFGKVKGNLFVSERCELKANAQVEGDITSGTISIEEGAIFMGVSQVGKKATSPAPGAKSSGSPSPAPKSDS
jgi:cytoskeletal protein CcmA (bactofilin family)